MKIVLISDTHGKHDQINNLLPDADMIICAGDISMFGNIGTINSFIHWFSNLDKYKYKIFIAGNHDKFFEEQHYLSMAIVPPNVTYLENTGVLINGIYIYGSPMTPRFFDWAFNVDRGEKIKKYWDMIPEHTDILVTHGPPYGILDNGRFNEKTGMSGEAVNRVGCEDLMNAVNIIKPKLHVFGHIHPGYGNLKQNETLFLNASCSNEKYDMTHNPFLIEINEETKEVKLLQ